MKNQFDILYESILKDLNSLEEYESEPIKEVKSYTEFKHFLNKFDLISKLDEEDTSTKDKKVIECTLYFANKYDTDHNLVKFDYYNKVNPSYYLQYKELFDELEDYRKHYTVTLSGEKDSPQILWG